MPVKTIIFLVFCFSSTFASEVRDTICNVSDTIDIEKCPSCYGGYFNLWGKTVSNYFAVVDSLSYDKTHIAVLSPVAMTPERDKDETTLHSDRLLLILHNGMEYVFDDVISNDDFSAVTGWEYLEKTDNGFALSREQGNGYKFYYSIYIEFVNNTPYIMRIELSEHNSALTFQRNTIYNYPLSQDPFLLSDYKRGIIDRLR
ncbi:hypothetical protein [Coprobacter tertius]|uniref:Uncharacterized protein n=1 Tax=Coprobacter tertius TaxID=2944915 RepID=A0ABT1MHR0_9BACT|nr:hypothetical protein [Coprobacter tertius]MCP9610761.1 hypothetical protein [Coprobacter tertius]